MNTIISRRASPMRSFLASALLVMPALTAHAQEHRHGAAITPPVSESPAAEATTSVPVPADDHARMGHGQMDHGQMDHGQMDHGQMDHGQMDHGQMDHGQMGHAQMDHGQMDHGQMNHGQMGHAVHEGGRAGSTSPKAPIPALTDTDRAAAHKSLRGPHHHGDAVHSLVVFNRFEAWEADPGTTIAWEGHAWIGTDTDRLWLRTEGERSGGDIEHADLELLYGRSVSAWWDVVAGVRQDFGPDASRTYASVGVIGLAPQKFEVKATLSVGSRQSTLRVEAERTLLLTGRLILQPLVEANLYARDDAGRGVGAGLSTVEAGLRLRYEIHRRFAPYIGVVNERAFGATARHRRVDGQDAGDTRLVAGVRFWF